MMEKYFVLCVFIIFLPFLDKAFSLHLYGTNHVLCVFIKYYLACLLARDTR